ncbi:MFS transporter [Nonomuraea sp. NPDC050786]|uniref:MFS transporter n=1 Tax=Nonomuraea sp. NPDC050786 TaxID=3154840 RepID=UPI0033DC0BFD
MLGGTLPIPLYAFWVPHMGFGPFTTTLAFAVYALGTVLALMMFASLSGHAGLRPLLAAAASTALFLIARDAGTLLAARFLCGLATGVFTSTATAAPSELAGGNARRAAMVSTAANTGWLGLGAVMAGVFAEYGTNPTHLVFWVYLATLAPAFLAVTITPETVAVRGRPALDVRRPAVPACEAGRPEFWRAAAAVFAAYTGSIAPTPALGLLNQALDEDLATLLLSVAVAATTLASALRRPTPAA